MKWILEIGKYFNGDYSSLNYIRKEIRNLNVECSEIKKQIKNLKSQKARLIKRP